MRQRLAAPRRAAAWAEAVDPGAHRRVKGLRLVTAYGIAALLGALPDIRGNLPDSAALAGLAGSFALWASVFEARSSRAESSRDLALMCIAATVGAAWMILWTPVLRGNAGPELSLVPAAFLVSYLKRFGVLGAGIGSQFFIGQMLALNAGLRPADLAMVALAGILAMVAAIVPRILSGPAERPVPPPPVTPLGGRLPAELISGLQCGIAALAIVILQHYLHLVEASWAIAACTYVVANSPAETVRRIRHRIIGTAIGVPLGLACMPIVPVSPALIWILAAIAMVIYAISLPERYDVACGAYAFTLMITLAVTGETSVFFLASRAWETLLGGALGLLLALSITPLLGRGRVQRA